jgi:hypothetical protein
MGYAIEAELLKLKGLFATATAPSNDTQPVEDDQAVFEYLINKFNN